MRATAGGTLLGMALVAACSDGLVRRAAPAPHADELDIEVTTGLPPVSGSPAVGPQGERTVVGVRVMARVGAWAGGEAIYAQVTPVGLVIENRGDQALLVRLDLLELIASGGARSAALPPFELRFRDDGSAIAQAGAGGGLYTLRHVGFAVAAPYRHLYTGLSVWPGTATAGLDYHREHTKYWSRLGGSPSPEMQRRALPEGVLRPGGRASGFVYFEKVPAKTKAVTLSYRLEDPQADVLFGKLDMRLVPAAEVITAAPPEQAKAPAKASERQPSPRMDRRRKTQQRQRKRRGSARPRPRP